MSEEKKQPEITRGPAALPEGPSGEAELGPATREAPRKPQMGAPTPVAEAGAAPAKFSVPDDRELQAWNEQVRRRMRHQTRRGFLGLAAGLVTGFGAWKWLTSRREIDGLPWPFRKTLELNEQLARDYFSSRRLAPTFGPERAGADRVNGDVGMEDEIDMAAWKLHVEGLASQDGPLTLSLDAIKKLPRREMTTELKCIEGWSVAVRWAGARFTDFMQAYPPETLSGDALNFNHPEDMPPYVSMETPDGGYYVGLDLESMLHPQTLLCYEMNGSPLTDEHGAPLRLVIPVKYGVKNIKRIGTIRYSTPRPADYWAERGYDWYIGL
jgi:hypothetical protein